MRYLLNLFVLFASLCMFAQNTTSNIASITRPSPTVAQMMKIEESQLDYYSGQPQITIPLYDLSRDNLSVPLALSYNSTGIRVAEASGWVGRGWSLNVGGAISRTVLDLPDEINTSRHKGSNYNQYHDFYSFSPTSHSRRRFSYDAQWRTDVDMDSKNDVYQFNFMGKTGRFVFTKIGNILQPTMIGEDNNYKIDVSYSNTSSPWYPVEIESFTITDDNGYKYFFTTKERTEKRDMTFVYMQDGCNTLVAPTEYDAIGKFISAWHLTNVHNQNGANLITFEYNDVIEKPIAPMTQTQYFPEYLQNVYHNDCPEMVRCALKPSRITTQPFSIIETKKIAEIRFRDGSFAKFNLKQNHPDYRENSGAYLKQIQLFNGTDSVEVRSFDFDYSNRLFLNKIKVNGSELGGYSFEYDNAEMFPFYSYSESTQKDIFGYPKIENDVMGSCTGALTRIIYPTQGSKNLVWEPNTYSYKGDQLVTALEVFENPDNYTLDENNLVDPFINNSSDLNRPYRIVEVNFEQDAFVMASTQSSAVFDFVIPNSVEIIPIVSASDHTVDMLRNIIRFPIGINEAISKKVRFKQGVYKVYFHSLNHSISNSDLIRGNLDVRIKRPKSTLNWFLYGGGIRIKAMYDTDSDDVVKSKEFRYNFDNPNIVPVDLPPYFNTRHGNYVLNFSSGSLDGMDNLFKRYRTTVKPILNIDFQHPNNDQPVDYIVEEQRSEIDVQLTKGNYIGYKNVKELVTDTNYHLTGAINSAIRYEFDSAIDFPSILSNNPSIPVRGKEYKHGNVRRIAYFTGSGSLIAEENFKYNYDTADIEYVVKKNFQPLNDDNYISGTCQQLRVVFTSYDRLISNFISAAQYTISCAGQPSFVPQAFLEMDKTACIANLSDTYLSLEDTKHKVQVTERSKTEYFSSGNVITKEILSYRDSYKKLFKRIFFNSDGLASETRFYSIQDPETYNLPYRNELVSKNIIANHVKVENFVDGELTRSSETIIDNFTSTSSSGTLSQLLPKLVKESKSNAVSKTLINFNRYDIYGQPLEVQQENGMKTSYIYGYNQTEPVAKIENMAYASIPPSLITSIHAATEATLPAALNALRSAPALSGALVTTYTYKPLEGVASFTDPKGDTVTYIYDSFGRLEEVRDKDNNLLSDNKYQYRTQH